MLEKRLAKWLRDKNYRCFYDFPLGGKFPDLIAIRDGELVAFELKSHIGDREIQTALGQCLFYLKGANKAFIAIPAEEMPLMAKTAIEILGDYGVGLIAIDENKIKILLDAKKTEKDCSSAIEEIKRKATSQIKESKFDSGFKDRVLETIKSHPEGLTITNISRLLGISRVTASKYVFWLLAEDRVYQKKIGSAKLCYVKEKVR